LSLIGFFIVVKIESKKRFYGKTAGSFLIIYAIITFIVEIWRDIPNRAISSVLSWNQVSAIIIIPISILFLIKLSNSQPLKKEGEFETDIGVTIDIEEQESKSQIISIK
jgi:prolipoprotein diacylglyceryltransferase